MKGRCYYFYFETSKIRVEGLNLGFRLFNQCISFFWVCVLRTGVCVVCRCVCMCGRDQRLMLSVSLLFSLLFEIGSHWAWNLLTMQDWSDPQLSISVHSTVMTGRYCHAELFVHTRNVKWGPHAVHQTSLLLSYYIIQSDGFLAGVQVSWFLSFLRLILFA